jgi:dethiobiotin synthetase/adenosylmethionine--8-amino-7-oxononanoate aminotransferase
VLCLENGYYRNHEFLKDYFGERGVGFWSFDTPPEKRGSMEEDGERLGEWYKGITVGRGGEVVDSLDREHEERIRKIDGMPQRTMESVWWPFTQHGLVSSLVCSIRFILIRQ